HTRSDRDWSSDVCSSDLALQSDVAAGVSAAVGNVRLKGVATPQSLALYPARPFVIGEVVVPGPHSRLRWGEVAADRVAVEVELRSEERRVGKECGPRGWS